MSTLKKISLQSWFCVSASSNSSPRNFITQIADLCDFFYVFRWFSSARQEKARMAKIINVNPLQMILHIECIKLFFNENCWRLVFFHHNFICYNLDFISPNYSTTRLIENVSSIAFCHSNLFFRSSDWYSPLFLPINQHIYFIRGIIIKQSRWFS